MRKFQKQQAGIGLIEIMVALVVVAVGILGIAKLQTKVVRSASDANARTIAAVIAQNKVDELRSFNYLSDDASGYDASKDFAFNLIDDGGPTTVTGAVPNTDFTLSWDLIGNYYYGATPLTAATAQNNTELPDFKVVEVRVEWTDIDGSAQTHTLRTVIDGYPPLFTSLSGNATIGSNPPIIPYTPEAAPDVVPVTLDIGDKKKESSKPVPEVSKKGDSTTVRFETVTYENLNVALNLADTVKREEFLTAKCLCRNGASANTLEVTKGSTVWDEENEKLKDITTPVPKDASPIIETDPDNTGGELQATECSICCRDQADTVSGFKSCRLKRIDGVMRIVDEWKMIALNLIPSTYFNDDTGSADNSLAAMDASKQAANIERYSNYVISVVRTALASIDGGGDRQTNYENLGVDTNFNSYSDVNDFNTDGVNHLQLTQETTSLADILSDIASAITPTSNRRQLQVRAVYLDIPPTGIYESGAYSTVDVPLDRVPFFENNFTQVAGWVPDVNVGQNGAGTGDTVLDSTYTLKHDDMDGADCVNDDAPNTGRNYVTNEDFFYASGGATTDCSQIASRGMVYPFVAASQAISTIMFTGNDGITDFNVNSASTATDTLTLEVSP